MKFGGIYHEVKKTGDRFELSFAKQWFRPNSGKPFTHADRIPIKINGGREGGYPAYTFKQRLDQGDWRMDVDAEDGRVIGLVSVRAEKGLVRRRNPATIKY